MEFKKDLRNNPRVLAAWKGLGCDKGIRIWGVNTKPTTSSYPEMAFEMRDTSEEGIWMTQMYECFGDMYDEPLYKSNPEEWIIAATLAYEAGEE